jgi:hypothetical protein
LRLRVATLLPSYSVPFLEGHIGVGYRHLFLAEFRVRPFLGVSAVAFIGTECLDDVCGVIGVGGTGEAGIEYMLGNRLRLQVWASVLLRTSSSPPATPMPALWVGLGW